MDEPPVPCTRQYAWHDCVRVALRQRERAFGILHRMGTERTGWRTIFWRWYYPDEPLRNDAANLVRETKFEMPMPPDTKLVGDDQDDHWALG